MLHIYNDFNLLKETLNINSIVDVKRLAKKKAFQLIWSQISQIAEHVVKVLANPQRSIKYGHQQGLNQHGRHCTTIDNTMIENLPSIVWDLNFGIKVG